MDERMVEIASALERRETEPSPTPMFGELIELKVPTKLKKPWFPPKCRVVPAPPKWEANRERGFAERLHAAVIDPYESHMGSICVSILMTIILIATITFVIETLPSQLEFTEECKVCKPLSKDQASNETAVSERASFAEYCKSKDCEPQPAGFYNLIETVAIAIFTAEYGTRVLTCWAVLSSEERSMSEETNRLTLFQQHRAVKRIWRFVTEPMNIVDLVSIVPYFIALANVSQANLGIVRVIRLLRLTRIVRIGRFTDGMWMFIQVFRLSAMGFAILLFFTLFGMVIFGSLVYYAEQGTWDPASGRYMRPSLNYFDPDQPTPYTSIPQTFWWVLVTITTVGYGDISPTTPIGRLLAGFTIYMGILFLALPITIIGANFSDLYNELQEKIRLDKEDQVRRGEMLVRLFTTTTNAPIVRAWGKWRDFVRNERKKKEDIETTFKRLLDSRFDDFEEKLGLQRAKTPRMTPRLPAPAAQKHSISEDVLQTMVRTAVKQEMVELKKELVAKLERGLSGR
eukprot:c17520_g1_i2.p1 GENE.c17520_g1_i2~~c17520_g1_i2.p1  ORF type:complete len:558 (+),score=132.67 c17520_g1_i2:132-1676(+)